MCPSLAATLQDCYCSCTCLLTKREYLATGEGGCTEVGVIMG